MPEEKNFFAGLVDFSFEQQLMRRIVKVLYICLLYTSPSPRDRG